jgi:hypothetical protein
MEQDIQHETSEQEIRYNLLTKYLFSWEAENQGFDNVMKLTVALLEGKNGDRGKADASLMLDVILNERKQALDDYIKRNFNLDTTYFSKELIKDILL